MQHTIMIHESVSCSKRVNFAGEKILYSRKGPFAHQLWQFTQEKNKDNVTPRSHSRHRKQISYFIFRAKHLAVDFNTWREKRKLYH